MEEVSSAWDLDVLTGVWAIEIVVGILVLVLVNFGIKKVLRYLRRRSLSTPYDWKEKLEQICYLPIHFLLWILGVTYVIDVLGHHFGFSAALNYLDSFRNAAVISCLSWLLLRWKNEVQNSIIVKNQIGKKSIDPGTAHILGKLLTIIISVITLMIILQIIGLDVMPLIAFGGIGAAAIGFAGKDVIANFFGGLMLYISRPFTAGDLILLPEKNIEGHVEEIGWYTTSIRDKEKRPVYLPNAMFSTLLVINSSRMSHRRLLEVISIRQEDFPKIEAIVKEIRQVILSDSLIDKNLPVHVFFTEFSDYALKIHLDAYSLATRHDEFLQFKQEILIKIQKVLDAHGAVMPFPTSVTIYPSESS